jgi:hypothetical protein
VCFEEDVGGIRVHCFVSLPCTHFLNGSCDVVLVLTLLVALRTSSERCWRLGFGTSSASRVEGVFTMRPLNKISIMVVRRRLLVRWDRMARITTRLLCKGHEYCGESKRGGLIT